ncbi:MAG TPA: GlmU family protein [Cyclobacteriaceae bacterium]|nr:GlmU family protein [Cyclobacteriaceae bacterium]
MTCILFDDPQLRNHLLPLTYTRPISEIRVGILTIREKWEKALGQKPGYITASYLQKKYPLPKSSDYLFINAALCPNAALLKEIESLRNGEGILHNGNLLAAKHNEPGIPMIENLICKNFEADINLIDRVWKIFSLNAAELKTDFSFITAGRQSAAIQDKHTIVYNRNQIFLEEGVNIKAAVLNAEDGPIYLGKNAVVQEGALIKGSFALCEGSHVNMGAKMRGDTTIGPFSKVGGEISNSVIFGYSNKAHDGFLGNAVIGEWCNIGADSNNSNLKNNYENVKLWSYVKNGFEDTGLQFCGLIMGDHSKCGINTMFNTGTVIGVSANIFGDGFPRNFIPSFAWGGAAGFTTFQLKKAFETTEKVMARRKVVFDEVEKNILEKVFELSALQRVWEKK